jgi:hypothetical protein
MVGVFTADAFVCVVAASAAWFVNPAVGQTIAPQLIPQAPVVPHWDWKVLPTAFHGANKTGVYSPEAVDQLALFQMVTIEKWYTHCASQGPTQGPPSCAVEEKIEHVLGRIKAVNPKTIGVMYLNSMLDFQFYTLHGILTNAEQQGRKSFLRDETGKIISLCNDGDVYCNITTFDWTQEHVRDAWLEAITNATATGNVDGIFADHSAQESIQIGAPTNGQGPNQLCNGERGGRHCYNFTPAFTKSFNSWHLFMTNKSQDLLAKTTNGPVICGPLAKYGIQCEFDSIRKAQEGYSYIEVSHYNGHPRPDENCIASFLAAADVGTYLTQFAGAPTTWPEQSYPLGAPNGPATETAPGFWHRKFASGTEVWYENNANRKNGTVKWGGGQPPPPPAPPPPAPPPPTPPTPPQPQPPASCGNLLRNTGVSEYDLGTKSVASVTECCDFCKANAECTQWAWHAEASGKLCHIHTAKATRVPGKTGCYAGVLNQSAHLVNTL